MSPGNRFLRSQRHTQIAVGNYSHDFLFWVYDWEHSTVAIPQNFNRGPQICFRRAKRRSSHHYVLYFHCLSPSRTLLRHHPIALRSARHVWPLRFRRRFSEKHVLMDHGLFLPSRLALLPLNLLFRARCRGYFGLCCYPFLRHVAPPLPSFAEDPHSQFLRCPSGRAGP